MNRAARGLLGASLALLVTFAFSLGLQVRACLPKHPDLIPIETIEVFLVGFDVNVPVVVAGFLIGYFIRLRQTPTIVCTLFLIAVAFGAGYALARGGCFPL